MPNMNNPQEDTKVAGPEPTAAMPAVEDAPHVQLPSVEELRKQVEAGEYPPVANTGPQNVPGTVDVASFLRAQHSFIEVQTWFFGTSHNGSYEKALLTYSKAQAAYISAM